MEYDINVVALTELVLIILKLSRQQVNTEDVLSLHTTEL